jgi:hypothetical protein
MKELCGVTLEATVEEGDPRSGLKNVMRTNMRVKDREISHIRLDIVSLVIQFLKIII